MERSKRRIAKCEYQKKYAKKNFVSEKRIAAGGENSGKIPCLKCDKVFESPDRIKIRICPSCKEINKSVPNFCEGW